MRKQLVLISMLAAATTQAGVIESNGKTHEKAGREPPASQLRCWQYGTMIFEETNLTAKQLPSGDKGIVFARKSGQEKLYLFNLDGAACVYRESD